MANGRNGRKRPTGRDGDHFAALPWVVLDSPGYLGLSHPARSLLLEIARQYVQGRNGQLLCSRAHLAKRGWRSAGVIQRAKDELLAAGLIFETVKGQRPNRASWYALTWYVLDKSGDYDDGAAALFERGAYRKNAPLVPSHGTERPSIVPSKRTENPSPVLAERTIRGVLTPSPVLLERHHLDKPSAAAKRTAASTT